MLATAALLAVFRLLGAADAGALPAAPFLARALGAPSGTALLLQAPVDGVTVSIAGAGYEVARAGRSVSLTWEDKAVTWRRFENGASRLTAFGEETILVEDLKTELYLTVRRRQGLRTWRWRIAAPGLEPRLGDDGAVSFVREGRLVAHSIPPVAILDRHGRNVTPAGLRWALATDGGSRWLELRLDDAGLPLPYVIDPAIALRSFATAHSGGTAASLTIAKSAGLAENDLLLAQIGFDKGSGVTLTPPSGWSFIRRDDRTTKIGQALYYKVASAAEPASYTWSFSPSARAGGGIIAYTGVDNGSPVDASSGATGKSASATAASITTTAAGARVIGFYDLDTGSSFTPPAGMTELYDVKSGNPTVEAADLTQASAGATGNLTATAAKSDDWVAQLIALRLDAAAPASALSVTEGTRPDLQYFDPASRTLYYNPAAAGDFTISDAASDGGSGVQQVDFPAISETGFTGSAKTDTTSAYDSNVYSFTSASAAVPSPQTVTVTDNAGNQTADTVTFVRDVTPPSGGSVAYPDGYDADGAVAITTANGSDAGAGIDASSGALERGTATLAGGSCGSFGSWSVVTSPDALASGLCAQYRYRVSDRITNEAIYTAASVVRVDTSPPAVSLTAPSTGARIANGQTISASATDIASGIAEVEFRYCAGASCAFGSGTPIGSDQTAPSVVAWNAQPADGTYTLIARATDNAGNATDSAPTAVTVDGAAPTVTLGALGAALQSAVVLTAAATPDAIEVVFQRRAAASAWAVIAADSDAPFAVAFDTAVVPDGRYELRAVATDGLGNSAASEARAVQIANGGPPVSNDGSSQPAGLPETVPREPAPADQPEDAGSLLPLEEDAVALAVPREVSLANRDFVAARVVLKRPARVRAILTDRRGTAIGKWFWRLGSGAQLLRMWLTGAEFPPGLYELTVGPVTGQGASGPTRQGDPLDDYAGRQLARCRRAGLLDGRVSADPLARARQWRLFSAQLAAQARQAGYLRPREYLRTAVEIGGPPTARPAKSLIRIVSGPLEPSAAPVDVARVGGADLPGQIDWLEGHRVIPASAETVFELVADRRYNVRIVVVDLRASRLELVRDLLLVFPEVRVLALSDSAEARAAAVREGAALVLPRSISTQGLARAIGLVAGSETWPREEMTPTARGAPSEPDERAAPDSCSPHGASCAASPGS